MEERTRFIYIVKNLKDEALMISDLGAGGFALPPHREVPLHEIFPWTMLEQSRSLKLEKDNGNIEVRKEIIFPGQTKQTMNISEVQRTQELNEIKSQIANLQNLIISQQNKTPVETSINNNQQLNLEELTNLIVSKIPKQETIIQQFVSSEKQTTEALDGYEEPTPQDIATKHLTSGDKLDSSIKEGKNKTIKEHKTTHNADDIADLLSQSGL